MSFTAPEVDYAGLSPVIALTAGICVVLLAGLVGERRQRPLVSVLSLATLAAAAGLCIWQWGERKDLVAGALRLDELGLAGALIAILAAAVVVPLSWREPAAERPRRGAPPRGVPGALALLGPRHGPAGPGPEPGLVLRRHRAALRAALRALRLRPPAPGLAGVRPQVPDRRLARLGDPALRPGLHLRRLRLHRLHGHPRGDRLGARRRPAGLDRDRAWPRPGSPSRSRSPPSINGRRTSTRARPRP